MPFDPLHVNYESEDDIDPIQTAKVDNQGVEYNPDLPDAEKKLYKMWNIFIRTKYQ
jgi:hypothetical protein